MSERIVIAVSKENKAELDKMKVHKRQSYDEVISILLEAYESVHAQHNIKAPKGLNADG